MLPTVNHEANRRTATESRMREIRTSGSMRGRRVRWFTNRASLLYLKITERQGVALRYSQSFRSNLGSSV
jgi:hypothetical protein